MMNDLEMIAAQLRQPSGEAGLKTAENMNRSNEKLTALTVESLGLSTNEEVLEIGMGNGKFVSKILSTAKGINYSGLDYSTLMVNQATIFNKEFVKGGSAKFIYGDACSMPFKDQSFDKIFCVNVLYFWEKPEVVLSEIRRVLKNEGLFSIGIRIKDQMELMPFTRYGFTLYSENDLKSLLKKNDFSIISERSEDEQHELNENVITLANVAVACKKNTVGL